MVGARDNRSDQTPQKSVTFMGQIDINLKHEKRIRRHYNGYGDIFKPTFQVFVYSLYILKSISQKSNDLQFPSKTLRIIRFEEYYLIHVDKRV